MIEEFKQLASQLAKVEETKVGKSIYKEIRNCFIVFKKPKLFFPKDTVITKKFLKDEWEFRINRKIKEAPIHPYTKKQRYEYKDVGKRLHQALRVIRWGRAPITGIVLVLNPTGEKRERGHLPCTIGYHLTIRNNKLETTIMMRANTFPEMFISDMNLAVMLHKYSAKKLKVKAGKLIYFSARTYKKI